MISVPVLEALPGIRHGFFTRNGGVSDGLYESLNCGYGSGDQPERVAVNRGRAMVRLGLPADSLVTAYQIHSARVVRVEHPWPQDQAPQADGMVTTVPGITLGILTADCVPVLLADADCPVIGACHAGWKGALGGIVEATVSAMAALGARPGRICAAIGPCIAQESYEVGPEFVERLVSQDETSRELFCPAGRPGHQMFDLSGYVGRRLAATGVTTCYRCPDDTRAQPHRFFSFRRATLAGETVYGRNLSAIALAAGSKDSPDSPLPGQGIPG